MPLTWARLIITSGMEMDGEGDGAAADDDDDDDDPDDARHDDGDGGDDFHLREGISPAESPRQEGLYLSVSFPS